MFKGFGAEELIVANCWQPVHKSEYVVHVKLVTWNVSDQLLCPINSFIRKVAPPIVFKSFVVHEASRLPNPAPKVDHRIFLIKPLNHALPHFQVAGFMPGFVIFG